MSEEKEVRVSADISGQQLAALMKVMLSDNPVFSILINPDSPGSRFIIKAEIKEIILP